MMQYHKHDTSPRITANKSHFLIISMAASVLILLLSLILFFSISAVSRGHKHPSSAANGESSAVVIHEACRAARDPETCETWLSQSNSDPTNATVTEVVRLAMWVSAQNLKKGRELVQEILEASAGNKNRTYAAQTCLDILHYSDYRTNQADGALMNGKLKDARAWLSAALAYQYGCWSGLKYVNDTSLVDRAMFFLNSSLVASTGNTLSMAVNYDIHGEKTESWAPPKTERDGLWESASASSGAAVVGGVPSGLNADVTVCGVGGGCDHRTIQEAVDAAPETLGPGKRFVIWIKEGVYVETVRVPLEKKNVVMMGDGMGRTVITGSMNVGQPGMTTYESATVGVLGDGFMATGLTIENTAGPNAHQAVAFRSDSDLSVIENCEFIGNQDTLYAHSLRQYYKSCRILGNVDFIFGNSASFFQDCTILVSPRQQNPTSGENNAVTAQGRIDPAQSTGFVFQNCLINGTAEYMALYYSKPKVHRNYLGRPWKEYSRTVLIGCTLEALIAEDGWMSWSGDFALNTLYYGEFGNTGSGSNTSKRVAWSSIIPEEHVHAYSIQNFIQGDQWIPTST